MSMSDPIADLLTRVRNALHAQFATVEAPASSIKEEICRVLRDEGYIQGFTRHEDGRQGILKISLKYTHDRKPVIRGLSRVSKPSLRVFVGSKEIPMVRSGLGVAILSTSRGVMSGGRARREKLGGELLCKVW